MPSFRACLCKKRTEQVIAMIVGLIQPSPGLLQRINLQSPCAECPRKTADILVYPCDCVMMMGHQLLQCRISTQNGTERPSSHCRLRPTTDNALWYAGTRILGSWSGALVGSHFHCVVTALYISEGVTYCLAVTLELIFQSRILLVASNH